MARDKRLCYSAIYKLRRMVTGQVLLKPLSVNSAYRGRRFDTPEKKKFVADCRLFLKPGSVPDGPLAVCFEFGLSNKGQDIDGPVKVCLDILQKLYNFNDNRVYDLRVKKVIVSKGKEYWSFKIKAHEQD